MLVRESREEVDDIEEVVVVVEVMVAPWCDFHSEYD